MNALENAYLRNLTAGMEAHTALREAVIMVLSDLLPILTEGSRSHAELRHYLVFYGFNDPESILFALQSQEETPEPTKYADIISNIIMDHHRSMRGIPTPECITSHLPKERKPTKEELFEAFRRCRDLE